MSTAARRPLSVVAAAAALAATLALCPGCTPHEVVTAEVEAPRPPANEASPSVDEARPRSQAVAVAQAEVEEEPAPADLDAPIAGALAQAKLEEKPPVAKPAPVTANGRAAEKSPAAKKTHIKMGGDGMVLHGAGRGGGGQAVGSVGSGGSGGSGGSVRRVGSAAGGHGYGVGALGVSARSRVARRPRIVAPGVGMAPPRPPADFNREGYQPIEENGFQHVADKPLSTFGVDVDTASYANVRRYLHDGQRPPADAVRVEELVNYFRYDDAAPHDEDGAPFAVHTELTDCPWAEGHQLLRVGLQARQVRMAETKGRNLVFLLDTSGSMRSHDKLPLVQKALTTMVDHLDPSDRVAIVTYAGSAGVALDSTPVEDASRIKAVVRSLGAGGSTHGSAGIEAAYDIARKHFVRGGINRVILATDGDFNVGTSSLGGLQRLIERKRKTGVFLTVLGFGRGNLRDDTAEKLADKGNGSYAYIDSAHEARRVLIEQAGGTLVTVAKDVKIQVEFNPTQVARYRLIGYENRKLAARDFNDDTKDAGEIGAGHSVTALYELVPASAADAGRPEVDPLRYGKATEPNGIAAKAHDGAAQSSELALVKLRYKRPDGDKSTRLDTTVLARHLRAFDKSSDNLRFAAAVATFGMKLRGSKHAGAASWDDVHAWARGALGRDKQGLRGEFLRLVRLAEKS